MLLVRIGERNPNGDGQSYLFARDDGLHGTAAGEANGSARVGGTSIREPEDARLAEKVQGDENKGAVMIVTVDVEKAKGAEAAIAILVTRNELEKLIEAVKRGEWRMPFHEEVVNMRLEMEKAL